MKFLKSKFTARALLIPGVNFAILTIVGVNISSYFSGYFPPIDWIIIMSFGFCYAIYRIVFVELGKKIIVVEIKDKVLFKRNYLGQKAEYNFKNFEGYETSTIRTRTGMFEFLFLIENGKREVIISEQYHRNYKELKIAVNERTKFLGDANSGFWKEIKDSFSF